MKKGLILCVMAFLMPISKHIFAQTVDTTPPITPYWALGHIVWEDSINTSASALQLVRDYQAHDIPVTGIIIDSPWSVAYNDFQWDTARYPDYKDMLRKFREDDVKVILWTTGFMNVSSSDVPVQCSKNVDEALEKGYCVNNGKLSDWWKGRGAHLDFTNPEAVKWWTSQMDKVFVDGVCGWKADEGVRFTGDFVETSLGTMSNQAYRKYYYDVIFDQAIAKDPRAIMLARPFSHQGNSDQASINKLNLGWCGDFEGGWAGLKLQLSNIYESARHGYGAVATEVGGFHSTRSNKQELLRYAQFAAMTASIDNGGANGSFTNHLPWWHGDDATDIYRYYVTLHMEWAPYLFSTIVNAHLRGGSLMRNVNFKEESHQLGDDIFVKAITSDDDQVTFTMPAEGQWIDWFDGSIYSAGQSVTKTYPLDRYPIFIRKGAIIPMHIKNNVTTNGGDALKDKVTLYIVPNGITSRVLHLPVNDGIDYYDCTVTVDANKHTISVSADKNVDFHFIVKSKKGKQMNRSGKQFTVKY